MRLRDQTDEEATAAAAVRARLAVAFGDEAATAPFMDGWELKRAPVGLGVVLFGLCWGHPLHGDAFVTTSNVVELGEGYARTASGRLYALGREDREHRRRRVLTGQRGPVRIELAPEPDAAPGIRR